MNAATSLLPEEEAAALAFFDFARQLKASNSIDGFVEPTKPATAKHSGLERSNINLSKTMVELSAGIKFKADKRPHPNKVNSIARRKMAKLELDLCLLYVKRMADAFHSGDWEQDRSIMASMCVEECVFLWRCSGANIPEWCTIFTVYLNRILIAFNFIFIFRLTQSLADQTICGLDTLHQALGLLTDCIPDAIIEYQASSISNIGGLNTVQCPFQFTGTRVSSLSLDRPNNTTPMPGQTLIKCEQCDVSLQQIDVKGVIFLILNKANKVTRLEIVYDF